MQSWSNANVVNGLEEHNGGHSSESKSTVHCAKMRSGVGLAAALGGGGVAGLSGIYDLALAEERAFDGSVVLERLVEVAGIGDVASRLKVESTFDIVDSGCLNTIAN